MGKVYSCRQIAAVLGLIVIFFSLLSLVKMDGALDLIKANLFGTPVLNDRLFFTEENIDRFKFPALPNEELWPKVVLEGKSEDVEF